MRLSEHREVLDPVDGDVATWCRERSREVCRIGRVISQVELEVARLLVATEATHGVNNQRAASGTQVNSSTLTMRRPRTSAAPQSSW